MSDTAKLRHLPSVHQVLDRLPPSSSRFPHSLAVAEIRRAIDAARTEIRDGTPQPNPIPIEQRDASEITNGLGRQTAPNDVDVYNPAFDVTPAELITAIITERGVIRAPYARAIRELFPNADAPS